MHRPSSKHSREDSGKSHGNAELRQKLVVIVERGSQRDETSLSDRDRKTRMSLKELIKIVNEAGLTARWGESRPSTATSVKAKDDDITIEGILGRLTDSKDSNMTVSTFLDMLPVTSTPLSVSFSMYNLMHRRFIPHQTTLIWAWMKLSKYSKL